MTDQTIIILAALGGFCANILYKLIRDILRHRNGPSHREFANAVAIVSSFIAHHNRWHPKAKITAIAIEESTRLDVRWSVTTKVREK